LHKKKMVLCDPEADYAQQMAAYLEMDKDFPWEVEIFTKKEGLSESLEEIKADVLLMAESLLEENTKEAEAVINDAASCVLLLNESGTLQFSNFPNIDKYQEAEQVKAELLKLYAVKTDKVFPVLQTTQAARIIGFYSPVRRCLQTATAITYGKLLARSNRVLYLNFESYVSHLWLEENGKGDLAVLLYYLDEELQRFILHLKSLLHFQGDWAYIIPMRNSADIPCVKEEEWLKLIKQCSLSGLFDYILLDLSESMQGLLSILQQCHRIFTIVKEDRAGKAKMEKYLFLLQQRGCEDVKDKSTQLLIPALGKLPVNPEEYLRGELAEYVEKILEEQEKIYGI